jgi:outer membrane protein assembly factor BamB
MGRFYTLCIGCCSAVALIACSSVVFAAPPPAPVPLLPTRTVWTLALNNQLTAPPVCDDANVYFPIEGDRLTAYGIISGTQKWMVSARPQGALVAGDGLLFFVEPDMLTALHIADGSIAWQLPLTDKVVVHPVWDNGWLVVALESGTILAFRAADGHLVWKRDLGSPAHALPALASDRVYVPVTDGRIVALKVETGEPIWERRLGGPPNDILALENRLYAGSKDNFFYCLMAKDGRIDWRWRTGGDVLGTPIADEHRVYFVALDNVLRALDQTSGGQRWIRALPLRPVWGPARAGGTIVVAGQAPALRLYDLNEGTVAGEVPAGAEVADAPHAIEDPATKLPMLLVITHDIVKGAAAVLVMRSVDPVITPIAPLPNLVTLAPTLPSVK